MIYLFIWFCMGEFAIQGCLSSSGTYSMVLQGMLLDPRSSMVGTHLRARAATLAGPFAPSILPVADPSTQTELLKGEAAEWISNCSVETFLLGRTASRPACKRCCPGGKPPAAAGWAVGGSERHVWHQGCWGGVRQLVPNCTGPTPYGQTARNSHQHTGNRGGPIMQKNESLTWQGPARRDFPPKTEVSP